LPHPPRHQPPDILPHELHPNLFNLRPHPLVRGSRQHKPAHHAHLPLLTAPVLSSVTMRNSGAKYRHGILEFRSALQICQWMGVRDVFWQKSAWRRVERRRHRGRGRVWVFGLSEGRCATMASEDKVRLNQSHCPVRVWKAVGRTSSASREKGSHSTTQQAQQWHSHLLPHKTRTSRID
jgi:hypothetical protein